MQEYVSKNLEETIELGRQFALQIKKEGANVALKGNLGVGKTAFCKGVISQFTNISVDEITSPTFTLVEEYGSKLPVYHIDLYRIHDLQEAEDFPWEDYLAKGTLCLIEWVENFPTLEKFIDYYIYIEKNITNERLISLVKKDNDGRQKLIT